MEYVKLWKHGRYVDLSQDLLDFLFILSTVTRIFVFLLSSLQYLGPSRVLHHPDQPQQRMLDLLEGGLVRILTSRMTNFAFDTYPRKKYFDLHTAQKLARTTFRVVPNCARGGGGWIKSSSSLASEARALAFGQPARFARGLDNLFFLLPK